MSGRLVPPSGLVVEVGQQVLGPLRGSFRIVHMLSHWEGNIILDLGTKPPAIVIAGVREKNFYRQPLHGLQRKNVFLLSAHGAILVAWQQS